MNPDLLIARLACFAPALRALLAECPLADLRWRPPGGGWSLLEVLGHLGDEEVEDFRARLAAVLEDPTRNWPRIDPEGWVESRGYNELDPGRALERLVLERQRSVAWLRGLQHPDWSARCEHPKLGPIAAGDLLVSWAAHDALHLRQVARRLHDLALRDAPGFSAGYAGSW